MDKTRLHFHESLRHEVATFRRKEKFDEATLTMSFILMLLSYTFGTSPAQEHHAKHEHKVVHAAPAKPKAEHPHSQTHAENSKKRAGEAIKHRVSAEAKHPHTAPEKKKEHDKVAQKKHEHTSQEKRIVETLQKVVANVHRADHDYDNQRHKALEHVQAAPRSARAGRIREWQIRRYDTGKIGRDPPRGPHSVEVGAGGAIGEKRPRPSRRGPAESRPGRGQDSRGLENALMSSPH